MFLLPPFSPFNDASCIKNKFISASLTILLSSLLLSGCLSTSDESRTSRLSIDERNQQLDSLQDWTLVGKIAFIQEDSRESASINWQILQSIEDDNKSDARQKKFSDEIKEALALIASADGKISKQEKRLVQVFMKSSKYQ